MTFWPRDERIKGSTTGKRRNGLAKEQNRDYPNLGQGLVGAASLSEDQTKHLEWIFVNKPSTFDGACVDNRLKFGKQINLFPATHSQPIRSASSTIKQRAEQGANFLRTYVPDVEIPEELIRDQLVEDTTRSRELQNFDPYAGNILDVFEFKNRKNSVFLLFPTGETNGNLNLAQIQYPDALNVVFKPSATPLHVFATPIQQIASKKPSEHGQDAFVAVRTYSSTQIFALKYSNAYSNVIPTGLATLTRKDTDGETIVDMKHSINAPELLVVGDKGTVFNCDIGNGGRPRILSSEAKITRSSSDANQLWRISLGVNSEYYVISNKRVLQLDRRTNSAVDFSSVQLGKHVFTSAEDCKQGSILRLCTTSNIIWMDTRFANKPLLSYVHGRQYDRYLGTHTFANLPDTSLTLLTSRNNSLVTVYDVNQSMDCLIRLDKPPYLLPSDFSMYQTCIGHSFVWHDDYLGLARMSETEGVTYNEVLRPDVQTKTDYIVEMANDVQELVSATGKLRTGVGSLGLREYSEVDFQPAYDALFQEHFSGTKEFEDQTAEAVYQMLDYFPFYLQNKESPIENVLTTYDIAFRAGDEPGHSSRADFLTESIVDSKRGYRALKQGKLSPALVKAPWQRSTVTTLQRLDKDFRTDPSQFMDYLEEFKLSYNGHTSGNIREYQQDAAHELTLDLALSSHIYSESPFTGPNEVNQSLEFMTEALSLCGEPPQVEFGYLKPTRKMRESFYQKDQNESKILDLPLGVRLLLQGWDSTDPKDYVYKDPYIAADIPMQIKPKKSMADVQPPMIVTQSQLPPPVLASNMAGSSQSEPARRTVPPKIQPIGLSPFPEIPFEIFPPDKLKSGSSQDLMMITQVSPGPHGGRPTVKKKPAKKRLGGF